MFSGMQPSGGFHIGNYLGAVRDWVALQDQHRCFYCVVDLHALTQPYEPAAMRARVLDMAVELLACGIDPQKSTLFVQSQVPEHAELSWILSTVAPYGELSRMTQFKEKGERAEYVNCGLFTYPVLMAADILLYKATRVPVGEDLIQHLELTREIVRRWNGRYGEPALFAEPLPLHRSPLRIMGLDGKQRMSKSLGNYIGINEAPNEIFGKTMRISDDLMWRYFELLSFKQSLADISRMRADVAASQANPRDFKLALALELVERFHGKPAADESLRYWNETIKGGALPSEIELREIDVAADGVKLLQLLKQSGLLASTSEAIRKISEKGVRIDGEVVENRDAIFHSGASFILQVGKRSFLRVALRPI